MKLPLLQITASVVLMLTASADKLWADPTFDLAVSQGIGQYKDNGDGTFDGQKSSQTNLAARVRFEDFNAIGTQMDFDLSYVDGLENDDDENYVMAAVNGHAFTEVGAGITIGAVYGLHYNEQPGSEHDLGNSVSFRFTNVGLEARKEISGSVFALSLGQLWGGYEAISGRSINGWHNRGYGLLTHRRTTRNGLGIRNSLFVGDGIVEQDEAPFAALWNEVEIPLKSSGNRIFLAHQLNRGGNLTEGDYYTQNVLHIGFRKTFGAGDAQAQLFDNVSQIVQHQFAVARDFD